MTEVPTSSSVPARRGRIETMPAWGVILICLIYVISPIDFVPDFIPLLGQGDDLIAICLTVAEMIRRGKAS